jgi:hypothetical protein
VSYPFLGEEGFELAQAFLFPFAFTRARIDERGCLVVFFTAGHMSEQTGHDWVERTKERIRQLEALDLKDRFACYVALWKVVEAVRESVSGWHSWLVRPGIMADFSEEELNDFRVSLREMAIRFLRFDIKATEKLKAPPPPPTRESEQKYWV